LFLSCEPHSAPGRVHEHVENAAQSVGGGAMEQFIESPIVGAASRAGEVEDMVGWRRISFDSDSSTKSVDSPVQASWCYYYLWMPANLCKRLRRRQQQQQGAACCTCWIGGVLSQGHCKWAEPRLERECSGPMRAEPSLDRADPVGDVSAVFCMASGEEVFSNMSAASIYAGEPHDCQGPNQASAPPSR
jgi:hypothetical protein